MGETNRSQLGRNRGGLFLKKRKKARGALGIAVSGPRLGGERNAGAHGRFLKCAQVDLGKEEGRGRAFITCLS